MLVLIARSADLLWGRLRGMGGGEVRGHCFFFLRKFLILHAGAVLLASCSFHSRHD
jgi:hypothetical protein